MNKTPIALAADIGQRLIKNQCSLTTAESCTGGGLAYALTSVPGSSNWFEQGFVTYSNEAKIRQLGVSDKLLKTHGAVCGPVAETMAEGAIRVTGADFAIATSGIAGPNGGTADKPVGTVWIAWANHQGEIFSQCFQFSGDRESHSSTDTYRSLIAACTAKNNCIN